MSEITPLKKVETLALWHAVSWMDQVLRGWDKDDQPEIRELEAKRLATAKRALRKVNELRKQGL